MILFLDIENTIIDDTTETNLTGNENAFTINPTDL